MSNVKCEMDAAQLLREFLQMPLDSGDAVFERFAALPNAICGKGEKPQERFVYIRGTRKDAVLLTAHADTVWDNAYKTPHSGCADLGYENGVFYSTDDQCGIGADDRAGCAMLWALKDSGHSLLLTDGEEYGKSGVLYLKNRNRKLFRRINRHRFMLALDWNGTNRCLHHLIDNTAAFRKYIETALQLHDDGKGGGCDLRILCKSVCGTNIGVGYHRRHTTKEILVVSQWENTLKMLQGLLEKPQPRFRKSLCKRIRRRIAACIDALWKCKQYLMKKRNRTR